MIRTLLLAVLLARGLSLPAQTADAALTGTVTDPSAAAVAGARLTAYNTETGVTANVESNSAGVYLFAALPPGKYRLTASHIGFQKMVIDDVDLEVGGRQTIPLELRIGAMADVIEVKGAEDTQLGYNTSSVGNVITGRKVYELPLVGRNV